MPLTKAQAKSLDILEVARSLGMEMKRKSHREYYWAEHDSFKIDTVKNTWHWYSQADKYGDTINLVQEMRNVSYKEAMVFLETGSFPEAKPVEEERQPFNYTLAPYEQRFVEARSYLKEIRGLSDDTIDFFLEKGVLAQAKRKDKDGVIEDVLVFKYLDRNQQLVGASLQGLVPDQERHPGKGYLKQIMYQSESISGLNVSIGSPKRLIVTEAPIDLMSYYELHKGELNDVRLVAMEGLKEGVLSHYVLEILQERGELTMDERDYTKSSELTRTSNFLSVAAETSTLFQDHKYDDLITLAVDRDKAGTDFITKLREKKIPVIDARPPQREGQEKTDWNEILKQEKQLEKDAPDNSRLAQARRKLERLRGEQDEAISRAYSHQAQTNGQPMNDKRGGASFMRKQEQIEGQVFSKMDEIRKQEERVEHLEHQQHLKEMGLNRQGSGLEMSVQNIPRIREELEKAKRGESFFTKATLKRYQEELTRLEAISEQMGKTSIQPATQALIDEGLVNQWQKQPNTYFVKGLRRVALEMTEEGKFQLSSQTKYHPKTDEERLKVDELLAKQRQENVGLTPSNQEKSISPQPEPIEKNQDEAGWLEKNWDNLTFSIENKKTVVIDPTSIDKTVEEKQTPDNQESIELVWELHSKWEDELAEKIREDLGINYELQAWQFEKEMSRFITTDLDKLFAKRTRLERDAYFADSTTSIRKEIDRLDAQILEYIEKAPEQSQERLIDRTSGGTGSLQLEAEGSPTPVLETSTFEQTVTSHPTSSYPYLHFSTNYDKVQRRVGNYHPITPADLRRLNQYAPSIQSTASWYLSEMADSKISFVYADHGEENVLQVTFQKDNFIHLSGIRPFEEGKGAANFLDDIANGQGHYDGMLISNAIKDKLQVLPMLRDILDPHSFVLDDLSSVEKLHNLNMSEAIKAKDEDFLLLFKDIGDEKIPASLMKLKGELATNVKSLDEKIILGVYRERGGHIEQLSINEEYVKDKGAEMLSVLKNKQFEEVSKEIEQSTPENTLNSPLLDAVMFTQVLDTVYNLGVPGDISKTPEEFHQAWNQYLDYAKQHNDKFDQIVAAAGEDHLLDTNSDFYKEWEQDHIYKENYHVRLQMAEERPDGPKLPFKETELISYQEFARELYKANQSFYQLHQEGLKQVTSGHPEGYISPTKIQFSIYAPDGELIQDSIRYNIGEEINPIAHKERLGTREMREHPELMKIDGTIFTQYHLERLASELDISQFSYALEDTPYADQLLSQLPFGDLENSPIGFTDSSHDGRLGFISFDGMDSVEVENLSAWFEKLGVKDSPMEQLALIEKWQKEIKGLSEKVEQTISTVREEFEKSQEEEIKLEEQGYNKQELEHDADADGVSDEEELLQGTNPYDFRSKPGSKPEGEESLQADEIVLAAGSLAVADFIQNKDMAGLSRHLKEGIKEFLDSDKYKDYLTKMSQLNNYSNRNLRLILAQNPEARQVASFKQWKENFGRYVKKGEKALRIFKPMTKIKKDENNQPILDKNGKPETVTFFGLVPVFDVSQTEGKEMPKAAEVKEQLTDLDYANLYRALMAIAKENDVSVRFEEMENNKHGYYSVPENQIVLRSNEMNKAQIIKTFLHEMAHAELHHADNPQKENLTRSTAELQAESVAYVVSSYYGIDTSEYSFNYLSGWSADKETLADLEAQLDIVQQEAKSLMVRMDQALEQLRLSQEKQTKRSFEQKLEKFKEQGKQAVEEHKQELKADAQSKKEKGFSK
ncbi:PBECR4 domain-containing protein [Streptococcus oralis]|uniref:PBECR4 domain-containing protein n=1 Tax=Streptococcus oralis TaxID=1303 RepID=UPI001C1EE794|nr:PBECR4 domain-containing protein [Streptococcus oralis]MBU6873825.1 toprim domain-containing protein [Streptococcus oralis]